MKIAIEGCAHGELEKIYETIKDIENDSKIKIDLLLCCGDFQSTRNLEDLQTMAVPKKYLDICTFYKYYSGELIAPLLTIFIGGNHEASNYLQELPYGGWVAPNIYYMGYAGVVRINGIRIAGISGIYKGHDFLKGHHEFPPYTEQTIRSVYHVRQLEVFRLKQLSGKVDIFLSHDWPKGIFEYGDKAQLLRHKPYFAADMESGQLGSRPLEELLKTIKPAYWFAAHLHCKFAALVAHHEQSTGGDKDEASSDSESEEFDAVHKTNANAVPVTKFLALDKCLPRRRFLQVLDIPSENTEGDLHFEYDPEWLSILLTTNHLISVKNSNYYLPGKKSGAATSERHNFTPTVDELQHITTKFENLQIPENFCRIVPTFDPNEFPNYKHATIEQPIAKLNPQCTEFCTLLGIDDPLSLAMLANGKQLPQESSILDNSCCSEEQTDTSLLDDSYTSADQSMTPLKRKFNISLPAPSSSSPATKEVDKSVIALPEDSSEDEQKQCDVPQEVIATEEVATSTSTKKLKRRNQSIYQSEENE